MLHLPHHDGSALYVSNLTPALGEVVTVQLRVPAASKATRVWLRTTPDAEPHIEQCTMTREVNGPNGLVEQWWSGEVEVRNPVSKYRWLLDDPYRWVNQAGASPIDVTDAADFRLVSYDAPPAWAADAIVYQIFPDRFARSAGADSWQQFPEWAERSNWDEPTEPMWPAAMTQMYGGDFDGVVEHVDHLRALGINTIYSTPFFPARSNHRYDAASFDHADPLLGGDERFQAMVGALHDVDIRFLGDLTTNHSGNHHEWFASAQGNVESEEAGYYSFEQHPDAYDCWMGVPTLPKFNYNSPALAERLIDADDSVVAKWLNPPFNMDGWRIDVANMTGRSADTDLNHSVGKKLRARMNSTKADALLIQEHCHDATDDLRGDAWYSTMNYQGFTNPVWSWLGAPNDIAFFGLPMSVQLRPGTDVAATMNAFAAGISWRARTHNLNLLDSHDSIRFRTMCGGSAERQQLGVSLLLTFPGIPSIFQGDEFGMEANHSHLTRSPLPWHEQDRWDQSTLAWFTRLIGLRNMSPALRRGGFRWASIGADHLAFLRETTDERVLVVATRSDDPSASSGVQTAVTALGCSVGDNVRDLLDGGSTVTLGAFCEAAGRAGTHICSI